MFNSLGKAAPNWLDRWLRPLPQVNLVRAYSIHPRYCRWADWPIDPNLDAALEASLMAGHSILGIYVSPCGSFVPLPYVWSAGFYSEQPKLSYVVKLITEA